MKDLDGAVEYWEKLRLRNTRRVGMQEFPDVTFRGKTTPLSLKVAFAEIGSVQIEWLQAALIA